MGNVQEREGGGAVGDEESDSNASTHPYIYLTEERGLRQGDWSQRVISLHVRVT